MDSELANPQSATTNEHGIPLCEAPDRYFDSTLWGAFLSCFENGQAALRSISQPEIGIIGYYQRLVAAKPTPVGERARSELRRAELGRSIVNDFKQRLNNGQLIATGFTSLAIDRVRIPAERWSELWLNFLENGAEGGEIGFTSVRICEPIVVEAPADLLDRCISWMRTHSQAGKKAKKVLFAEALEYFGRELTTRIFDAAYKSVFLRPRGRPRKTEINLNEHDLAAGGPPPDSVASAAVQPPDIAAIQRRIKGTVKMIAPPGCSHVQGLDGRSHLIGPDRTVEVTEAEARSLIGAGFVRAETENQQ